MIGFDLRDRRQQRRRPDEIADLRGGDRRDAVDERRDAGEAEIQLRGLDRGLRRRDRRLRRVVRAHVVVELTLRDRALLGQRLVARQIALGLGELRLRLGQPRPRLGERGLERPPIDLEQHLALADEGALLIRRGESDSRRPAAGSAR